MNRAERRKHGVPKQPVIVVGDGIVATELGQRYEAKGAAELPAKVLGQHRWIATGSWVLSPSAVFHAQDGDLPQILDRENLMYLGVGCWDCEMALGQIQPHSVCSAKEPFDG